MSDTVGMMQGLAGENSPQRTSAKKKLAVTPHPIYPGITIINHREDVTTPEILPSHGHNFSKIAPVTAQKHHNSAAAAINSAEIFFPQQVTPTEPSVYTTALHPNPLSENNRAQLLPNSITIAPFKPTRPNRTCNKYVVTVVNPQGVKQTFNVNNQQNPDLLRLINSEAKDLEAIAENCHTICGQAFISNNFPTFVDARYGNTFVRPSGSTLYWSLSPTETLPMIKVAQTATCMFGKDMRGIWFNGKKVDIIEHHFNADHLVTSIIAETGPGIYEESAFASTYNVYKQAKQSGAEVIYHHLPVMDYIVFGLELYAKGKIKKEALDQYITKVQERGRQHKVVLEAIAQKIGIELVTYSPFDNLFAPSIGIDSNSCFKELNLTEDEVQALFTQFPTLGDFVKTVAQSSAPEPVACESEIEDLDYQTEPDYDDDDRHVRLFAKSFLTLFEALKRIEETRKTVPYVAASLPNTEEIRAELISLLLQKIHTKLTTNTFNQSHAEVWTHCIPPASSIEELLATANAAAVAISSQEAQRREGSSSSMLDESERPIHTQYESSGLASTFGQVQKLTYIPPVITMVSSRSDLRAFEEALEQYRAACDEVTTAREHELPNLEELETVERLSHQNLQRARAKLNNIFRQHSGRIDHTELRASLSQGQELPESFWSETVDNPWHNAPLRHDYSSTDDEQDLTADDEQGIAASDTINSHQIRNAGAQAGPQGNGSSSDEETTTDEDLQFTGGMDPLDQNDLVKRHHACNVADEEEQGSGRPVSPPTPTRGLNGLQRPASAPANIVSSWAAFNSPSPATSNKHHHGTDASTQYTPRGTPPLRQRVRTLR